MNSPVAWSELAGSLAPCEPATAFCRLNYLATAIRTPGPDDRDHLVLLCLKASTDWWVLNIRHPLTSQVDGKYEANWTIKILDDIDRKTQDVVVIDHVG